MSSRAKFALSEHTEIEVKAGQREELTVALSLEEVQAEVDVTTGRPVQRSTDSEASKRDRVSRKRTGGFAGPSP